MRIKIEGKVTRERIIAALDDLMARDPGMEFFTGFNMYLTPRDSEGVRIDLVRQDGQEIETLIYQEPCYKTEIDPRRPVKKKPQLSVVANNAA